MLINLVFVFSYIDILFVFCEFLGGNFFGFFFVVLVVVLEKLGVVCNVFLGDFFDGVIL